MIAVDVDVGVDVHVDIDVDVNVLSFWMGGGKSKKPAAPKFAKILE